MLSTIRKTLLFTGIALPLLFATGSAQALITNSTLASPLPLGTTTFNSTKTALQSFTDNWSFSQIASPGPNTYLKLSLPTATNLSFTSMYLFDTTTDPTKTNPLWSYATGQPSVFWGQVNPADSFSFQINGVTTASLSQYNGSIIAAVPEAPAWVLMLIGVAGVAAAVRIRQNRQGHGDTHRASPVTA